MQYASSPTITLLGGEDAYCILRVSRWPELNRRPTPSLIPRFRGMAAYMRIRLYLTHTAYTAQRPLSVVRAKARFRGFATVLAVSGL